MKKTGKERRLHPRLDKQLPINVVANGYDFMTNTHNISCVGAYCTIDKYVPPFTKVKIRMNLPIGAGSARQEHDVQCHGVIVRTDDEAAGRFNVAIFFDKIADHPRQVISQYVSQHLPREIVPSNS